MAQEEIRVEDVEEGEISDSASVEEISEADFNKQEVKPAKEEAKAKSEARVWTMQDLYKYQYKRGYTTGLYNLAWAQAVQNKPLNEVFNLEAKPDNSNSNWSSSALSVNSRESKNDGSVSKDGDRVVIDVEVDEKEEGELEEGEIDLDWEPKAKVSGEVEEDNFSAASDKANDKSRIELREIELREALENVVSSSSAISFDELCLRLQRSLENLQELVLVDPVVSKDRLAQQLFAAMQTLHSVFSSMEHSKKEVNKEVWKRVLTLVLKDDPSLISSKQLKEMEGMVRSLDCASDLSISKDKDAHLIDGSYGSPAVTSAGNPVSNLFRSSNAAEAIGPLNLADTTESLKQGFKGRILIPLLDLHKDHDADSLPSPTSQAPPTLTLPRAYSSADGMFKSELGTHKLPNGIEDFRMHPYQNEALKAVSSYQHKFGRTSSFTTDRLPSPTPSEEHACGTDDVGEEVSSSTTGNSNLPVSGRSISSSSSLVDSVIVQGLNAARSVPTSSVPNLPVKSLPKSRDPRLRFVNTDSGSMDLAQQASSLIKNPPRIEPFSGVTGSRKSRSIEESVIDGPEPKRQRSEFGNPGTTTDPRTTSGAVALVERIATSGWQPINRSQTLEIASDPRKIDNRTTFPVPNNDRANVTASGPEPLRVPSASAAPSLPELFKGIAVNPNMLANLLKIGQQQRFAAEAQQKPADPPKSMIGPLSGGSIPGVVTPASTAPMSSGIFNKPKGTQVTGQITPMDDTGSIRMKPRDPRRILHENTLQRSGSLGSGQLTSGIPVSRPQVEVPTDKRVAASQPVPALDITQQFTKNLKNIADIISTSQPSQSVPVVSPNHASQPMQSSSGLEVKTVGSSNPELQTGNCPVAHAGSSVPSQPQNSWGDVEHLFEGYDDQQKAAIQHERARRLEEQKKMFAARKLCLVLDLDHTLLNSAKFVEVEPVHDEMLRKKEEQDRDKSQRHLFRFPHMGMWTKLRPGIWNFLEKASKLYELHLYTMGNKLYATEMAKVLDPKGVLFAGRVISRGGDGDSVDGDDRYPKSKDLEGVLGMESSVVIIDDSLRVWPHNKLNLIVVERYTYFPSSRRQFGLLGPSLLEIDHDERPEDGTLASSLAVIERIHQIFFSHQSLDDLDVRNILATEQRKILGGCRIVFSRVFPVGEANPHLHPLWQTAEQFGAVCTNQIDDQVTHVVANSLGTDKVNWALSTGRFVVHPGWVEASALLYRRANEQDFAIKP